MTSKYAKYLLPIVLILILASTASALPTKTHGTVRGEMYVSSTANWPSTYSTNNFDVPNGTVVFARYYVGVWAGQSTHDIITTTFNGHSFPASPSYYSTEMGVTWIPYDVTDYLRPGEINTATIDSKYWGDGRQYGSTLVVVLKNETKPQIEYWVAEGCDWMHYADYMGYEVQNSTTYFNGSLDLDDVQKASLYSTHLTGFNYEDLNGKSLPGISESLGGEYFSYVRWDNVQSLLVPENQTVLVSRGSDTYCSVVFHGLSIEYKAADLVPVNLTPTTVVPNTSNTMTATIKNIGNKNSEPFNVSLMVNGNVVDTQQVSELATGGSTTVDLQWTPDGSTDAYSLTVVVDPENTVVESCETNNMLTSLVGTTSATAPIAEFSADKTSGYAPLTVTFTDQSTNSPISWAWDFENDGIVDSNEQNPIHIYSIPGTYTVKLIVSNAGGSNTSVNVDYITIFTAPPVAEFSADKISGDVPLTVNFTDKSANSPTSWAWDFENDGVIDSTEQNPTHILSTPGIYTVNLTVTNAGGTNSIVKTRYITVSAPGPIWTAKPSWNVPDRIRFSEPAAVDLDGDGDYDLLVGAQDGNMYAYENTGTASSPVWISKSAWNVPACKVPPYTVVYSKPALADLDGDGDYDLITRGDNILYGYENTGNKNNPIFERKATWNVPILSLSHASPFLVDLDDDGDYDLMIGADSGVIYGYENTGTKNNPVWTRKINWDSPDIGTRSSPTLADLDGDGDYDLMIGESYGTSYAYENTGNKSSPIWTAKSSWNTPFVGGHAAPCLVDLDGDGDYDLLIGTNIGITYAYENTAILESSIPDLSPTDITIPSSVYASIPCPATATIINTGTGDAGAFNATLSVNGMVVDTQSISGITSGSNALVNFSWTPEAEGDYDLTVTADPENTIAESDETNNTLTITVTASEAPTTPDTTNPVIESVVLFPANTTAGATINISVNATDDTEVIEVTAGDLKLNNIDGVWQGSITAPALLGSYSLSINATDAAGNTAEISVPYRVVQLSGGANIAVSPRASTVEKGSTVALNLKVKNTQNIDDTFKVRISVSGLPASYQADLSWFDWTEKTITLKAGEEVLLPVKVTVDEGTKAGRKLFRTNVKSETSTISGFDTGYLTIR